MKKQLTFLLVAIFILNQEYHAQAGLGWANHFGNNGNEAVYSTAVDQLGNVYHVGTFSSGTTDFDPGPGVYNITEANNYNGYITKLDNYGKFLWAKSFPKASPQGVETDTQGNVVFVGSYYSSADFDPGPDTFMLNTGMTGNAFVCKLSPTGDLVWAKSLQGGSYNMATAVDIDGSGNIYFAGGFEGVTDFDPDTGAYNLTSGGMYDIYITKLNQAGNLTWARSFPGWSSEMPYSIAVDDSGNVFTTGIIGGMTDFDPGPGVYAVNLVGVQVDAYVNKLDANGNFAWAYGIGSPGTESGTALALDGCGNVYCTGRFGGKADFDPGQDTLYLNAIGNHDAYVVKYANSGNMTWAKKFGGTGDDNPTDIVVDANSNCYLTGNFYYPIDLDPDTGSFTLTSAGDQDIYVNVLNASGKFVCGSAISGTGIQSAASMAIDGKDNIYLAGIIHDTADFDPGPGVFNLNHSGNDNIFMAKYMRGACNIYEPAPSVVTLSPTKVCSGDSITAVVKDSLAPNTAVNWFSFGCGETQVATGDTVKLAPPSTQTYYVRTEGACTRSECAPVVLPVSPTPTAAFTADYFLSCGKLNVEFKNQSSGADDYNWSFGDGSSSGQTNPQHSFNYNSAYQVSLTAGNNEGCSSVASATVQVKNFDEYFHLSPPNIFTPNNDGINDLFTIELEPGMRECASLSIYDRWGVPICISTGAKMEWNGQRESGRKADPGTYFYVLEINGLEYKGFVALQY
ncbi:MAG: gliding motility-associated C-terminal domain-containing protein [Bacteroidia bacterium]